MSTTTDPKHDIPVIVISDQPVTLDDLLGTDFKGDPCLPEASLDAIWPRDDREPLVVVGKGLTLPPTCEEQVPCHEKYGDEACLAFVFNGSGVDANVPLPGAGAVYVAALAALLLKRILA
jgi:hypothetical protein